MGLFLWLRHFWSCWFDLLIFAYIWLRSGFKEVPFPPDCDGDLEQGAIHAYIMSRAFLAEEQNFLLNELVYQLWGGGVFIQS